MLEIGRKAAVARIHTILIPLLIHPSLPPSLPFSSPSYPIVGLGVTCPVRIIHSLMDEEVPFQTALKLADCVQTKDVKVREGGRKEGREGGLLWRHGCWKPSKRERNEHTLNKPSLPSSLPPSLPPSLPRR